MIIGSKKMALFPKKEWLYRKREIKHRLYSKIKDIVRTRFKLEFLGIQKESCIIPRSKAQNYYAVYSIIPKYGNSIELLFRTDKDGNPLDTNGKEIIEFGIGRAIELIKNHYKNEKYKHS